MANATSLTVTSLTANADTADPTVSTFDTGTSAVTVKTTTLKKTDRFFMRVVNSGAGTLTTACNAGTDPPDFRAGVGAATAAALGAGNVTATIGWMGPFESSRFSQSDQTLSFTFTPSSGTIAFTVQCFTLPLV
jgi:hypothetical protein